jgi:hypothetical protein
MKYGMSANGPKRTFQVTGLMRTNEAAVRNHCWQQETGLAIILVLVMGQITKWAPQRTDR